MDVTTLRSDDVINPKLILLRIFQNSVLKPFRVINVFFYSQCDFVSTGLYNSLLCIMFWVGVLNWSRIIFCKEKLLQLITANTLKFLK